jgi:uncharacterized phiE125 gp8 family phage protein
MPLVMTSGPAVDPVSLAETKAFLRVDLHDEDMLIAGLVTAARVHLETRLGRALVTQGWQLWLDRPQLAAVVPLPLAPVQAVTAVTALDDEGAEVAVDPGSYALDPVSEPARLIFGRGVPSVRRHNGLRIDFTAGYGASPADVPQPLRQAIQLLVAHWYEEREPVAAGANAGELPHMVSALTAPYRRIGL